MKVTKKTTGSITIKNTMFRAGEAVEVSASIGKYIIDNFASVFTVEPIKKAPIKKALKEDK